jgi:hypothetical protein
MSGIASGASAGESPAGVTAPYVVHLVRAANGIEPFRAFLESYTRHPAGLRHELVLLFKGFTSDRDAAPYLELADGLYAHSIYVSDQGFDLTAYRTVAERLDGSYYCFLNSFSVILAPDWLRHMYSALRAPGVGLVGATGSWGSVRSYARFVLGLGGPYSHVLPDRRTTAAALASIAVRHAQAAPGSDRRTLPVVTFAATVLDQAHGFVSFPARHLRTTGFMIDNDVLGRVRMPKMRRKNDAYRLESGRDSITAQIERLALTARVVGRDGLAYGATDWFASRTFWQGDQENLLIADKQTTGYDQADAAVRDVLSHYAWGEFADTRSRQPQAMSASFSADQLSRDVQGG